MSAQHTVQAVFCGGPYDGCTLTMPDRPIVIMTEEIHPVVTYPMVTPPGIIVYVDRYGDTHYLRARYYDRQDAVTADGARKYVIRPVTD